MRLAERTSRDIKSFDDMVTNIADRRYDIDIGGMLLNSRCINIRMDAEISAALYPELVKPYLKMYFLCLTRCMGQIQEMLLDDNERELEQLNLVFGKLDRLARLFAELLVDR